ncbi:unnamed protein product [Lactuca saligna]|uniref:Uncharacterized protein n=1 Tax=Lactuca saligna TaxID=75948 RepID=A0AA35Z910_LACSI|nr:unnamed protein product [Lactuca saligna]
MYLRHKRLKFFNGIKGYAHIIEQNGKRDTKEELRGVYTEITSRGEILKFERIGDNILLLSLFLPFCIFGALQQYGVPPSPSPVRGVLDNSVSVSTIPSSPINKEEEVGGFPVCKSSPSFSESGLRNLRRGSLTSLTSQSSVTVLINPTNSNIISTNNALGVGQASEMAKRPMLGTDEGMVQ